MYVDISGATPGSILWIEYQSNVWVGAKVSSSGAQPCDPSKISNLTYVNNVLEFDFTNLFLLVISL